MFDYKHYDTHYYIGRNVRVLITNHKEPQVSITYGDREMLFNKPVAKELQKILTTALNEHHLDAIKEK